MPAQTDFEVRFYSPRWGHEDTYQIKLNMDQMNIKGKSKTAKCTWVQGRIPKWSGYDEMIGNPFEQILLNDHIYPPTVFVRALEQAWMAWRGDTLNDEEVQREVQELCEWVSEVTRRRPKTDFWRKIF